MNRLSACLITLNEERNLPRALRSLEGVADEIIVVECGSQDRTQEIARAYKAKAIMREWTDFAQQKNFEAASAHGDRNVSLDANEEIRHGIQQSLIVWRQE